MTNSDERRTIDEFKVAISLIKTGPDRFPLHGQGLELDILARKVLAIDMLYIGRDDLDAEQRSLLNLADATSKWIGETVTGDRDTDIAEAWFKARAELIEPAE